MDPIEPVSEENSDKSGKRERDRETWTVREKRVETHHPFLVCLLKMVSTISPALMLFFLIISANNAGDIFSCQLRVFLKII